MKVHAALRVTALSSGLNFGLSLLAAVVIARLLSPHEIGIHSVAVSLVAFTHVLREFGVGQYFLKLPVLSRDHLRAGFTAMLITSWAIAAALAVAAEPVSSFYGQKGIGEVFHVLAASFAILPFGSHILSQLKRDLRFDHLAVVQVVSMLVSTLFSIYFAWRGQSYLSMAWGTLIANAFTVLLLFWLRPALALLPPTTRYLAEIFRFGGLASSASLINQLGSSTPDLMLGKTQSMEAVAHYSRAAGMLGMIATKVDQIAIQVFTPTFADRIRSGSDVKAVLTRSITLHTGIAMPLLGALAVLGEPLTLFMFGQQWSVAASLAPWLLGYAAISAPVTLAQHALFAAGNAKAVFVGSMVVGGVLFGVFLSSIYLDLQQVVILSGAIHVTMLVVWSRALRKTFGLAIGALLMAAAPSALLMGVSVCFAATAALMQQRFNPDGTLLTTIVATCLAAAVAYLGALRLGRHPLREELANLAPWLRPVLCPRRPPAKE